eukprot:494456-Pyramimonas_sp.AAC.1
MSHAATSAHILASFTLFISSWPYMLSLVRPCVWLLVKPSHVEHSSAIVINPFGLIRRASNPTWIMPARDVRS